MDMGSSWEFWFAGASLLIAIFGCTWKITTRIGDSNRERDEKSAEKYKDFHAKLIAIRKEFVEGDEEVRKMVGEVGHASQSKIQQLELWARDNLVLKVDFRDDLHTITSLVDSLGTRIEKRLESFERKLDELQRFNMARGREDA